MKGEYITVMQAAQYLDASPSTIRRYLRQGKLSGKKHPVVGYWTVGLDSLQALALRLGWVERLPVLTFASEIDYLRSLPAEEPPAGEAGGLEGVTEYWFPSGCPARR
jgi:hypothetical protein